MTKIEYLYGVKHATWLSMKYVDALNEKIRLCDAVITTVLSVHHMKRDGNRLNKCIKAIAFNEKLIKE